jgi:predicted enzyme related to lactoylglutathione lyase
MFRTPGGLGGGIDGGPNAEAPSKVGPVLHIETEDIDAMLKEIQAAGGETLLPKTKISDTFGHYGLFLDNVGNRLGLWSR